MEGLEKIIDEMQVAENTLYETSPKMKNPDWWENGSPEPKQDDNK